MLDKLIRFFLVNKLVTVLILLVFVFWGIISAPFNWQIDWLPEDQITYPLTTALLGIPGVKTIRSNSIFGLSSIYIIFEDDVEFYWSRTRILEKLNSLPAGTLPAEVQPALGPDATALGQIFWYTLEGRNPESGHAREWCECTADNECRT